MKVVSGNRIPIKAWAEQVEDGALVQAANAANLPFAIGHIALMPDVHQGYGVPIGSVIFAELAVVPYAIGVDIGCGVILYQTNLSVGDLEGGVLRSVLNQILRDVPVGNGPGGNLKKPVELGLEDVPSLQWGWIERASGQLGTLGGGNHFIEVQADDEDRVYVMLHSGSRSLGKNICDHYHREALRLNSLWFSDLPHRELAYLPFETPEAQNYWAAMNAGLEFAVRNRAAMMEKVRYAFTRHASPAVEFEEVVDCHHNYAAWENHRGKNGIVHRKGAVRARKGEDVLIPGSMGTFSYWGRGLGNAESFETCQHGAGRAMSRGSARKAISLDDMNASLAEAGTMVVTHSLDAVRDEAPGAYKPIAQVMEDSADLVEIVQRLRPLGTVKG